IKKAKEISTLSKLAVANRSQLTIILKKRGILNDTQVQEIYRIQQAKREPVIRILLDKGWVDEKVIHDILRKDQLMEEVDLDQFQIESALIELIPRSFCERQLVLPLKLDGRRLLLAMADPLDSGLIEDMRFVSGLDIQPLLAPVTSIRAHINKAFGEDDSVNFHDLETVIGSNDPFENLEIILDDEDSTTLEELLQSTEEPPAIRLVN